jgi:hypothetical protein
MTTNQTPAPLCYQVGGASRIEQCTNENVRVNYRFEHAQTRLLFLMAFISAMISSSEIGPTC